MGEKQLRIDEALTTNMQALLEARGTNEKKVYLRGRLQMVDRVVQDLTEDELCHIRPRRGTHSQNKTNGINLEIHLASRRKGQRYMR